MINAIDTALRHCHASLPTSLLELAFSNGKEYPLDVRIKEQVIDSFVIPDCNLNGGKILQIQLQSAWNKRTKDDYWGVYAIPAEARENRNIVEINKVALTYGNNGLNYTDSITDRMTMVNKPAMDQTDCPLGALGYAMASMERSKRSYDPRAHVPIAENLGGNIIALRPSPRTFIPYTISARVAYDNEMTNLNSAAIMEFANLVVLAVKRYVYNKLVLQIQSGKIEFGSELAGVRDLISQWSNMDQEYMEACDNFSGATLMDMGEFQDLITSII